MPGLACLGVSFSAGGAVCGTTGPPLTATAVGPCADSLAVGRADRPMTHALRKTHGTANTSLATAPRYHGQRRSVVPSH